MELTNYFKKAYWLIVCPLSGVLGLVFLLAVAIFWEIDPLNIRAPGDAELIATFHNHRVAYEASRKNKNGLNQNEEAVSDIAPLGIGTDYDGTTRFVFAMGELLAIGSGWAKGIEYIPGGYEKKGDIKFELDAASKLPAGVYLREIEPHWFIFYQRDD